MTIKKENEWEVSYKNKNNFVFYPSEEIIRFVSKYIRKRVSYDDFVDVMKTDGVPKVLDFGCGIGRHVRFLDEFKLDAYGFDLSNEAINVARSIFEKTSRKHLCEKVMVADITKLPYEDGEFDCMLSHGVLDSMPFDVAKKGLVELHRCLKESGLVYMDLISTEDVSFKGGDLEVEVGTEHEKGTIQSYFDVERINELIKGLFVIKENKLILQSDLVNGYNICRYHLVVQKEK